MALYRIAKNNAYELYLHRSNNYFLLSFYGIWNNPTDVQYYIDDVKAALSRKTGDFNLLLDFRQYKGTTPEYMSLHIEALKLASNSGLKKTATIIQDNPLIKVTIDYIFEQAGINTCYFANEYMAQQWLERD